MKYSDLHYGQIPTSYKAVKSEALNSGVHAIFSLLKPPRTIRFAVSR